MKRGIFDIEDIVAYFVYFMIIIAFIVILSLPGCQQGAAKQGISGNAYDFQKLKIAQQLDVFLKMPMITPDEIVQTKFLGGLDVWAPGEKEFIEQNTWLYKGKTFEEFLQLLPLVEDGGWRDNLFRRASAAMFNKYVPEGSAAAISVEYTGTGKHSACLPLCAGVIPEALLATQEIPMPDKSKAAVKLYIQEVYAREK